MRINKMKQLFFVVLALLFTSVFAANDFSYYGTNEFLFIYRAMDENYQLKYDEENKYNVENRIQLRSNYKNLQAGLKFNLLYPKYEPFAATADDIHAEENEYYFQEYYLHYEKINTILRAGTFDAVIGSGIALHNYYDKDVDEDTSLRGGYFQYFNDIVTSKLFFGWMKHKEKKYRDENEFDQIGGTDFEFSFWNPLKIGASYAIQRHNQSLDANVEDDYLGRHIMSARTNVNLDFMEFNSEYAHSKDDDDQKADAFYTSLSAYLGKFTFLSAYKNYRDFNFYISDLPTANHSEEPLNISTEPGFDEEGILGEIRFIPNYKNELIISISEAWNADKSFRMADYFSSYKREFSFGSLTTAYSHLEQWQKDTNWHKEANPNIELRLYNRSFPMTFKFEYMMKKEANRALTKAYDEPKLQFDIAAGNYSISLFGATQIGDSFSAADGDIWLGMELAAFLFENTDIRLFVGKEKAGKVCRNGVCKFQPQFEGARLNITTTF